jgi:hypothetical protein
MELRIFKLLLLKLHGLSLRANYTDQATAACRRSDCQLLRIKSATWCDGSLRSYSRFSRQEPLLFYQVAPQLYSRDWVNPVPDPTTFFLVVPGIEPGPPDLQPRTLTTRLQRRLLLLLLLSNWHSIGPQKQCSTYKMCCRELLHNSVSSKNI